MMNSELTKFAQALLANLASGKIKSLRMEENIVVWTDNEGISRSIEDFDGCWILSTEREYQPDSFFCWSTEGSFNDAKNELFATRV